MNRIPAAFLLALMSAATANAESASAPVLSLPIVCDLGKDCFIQQYVDVLPGEGVKDYRCGIASYDHHKGTDFRVLSVSAAKAGVPVLAAAAGRVKAARDGMDDRLLASEADVALVKGRECGNGVVIDHGGGWETQYCHLRRGSLSVRKGQTVETATPLGLVGYSGRAQFPHVHLSVRLNGKIVDPFLGGTISGACRETDQALASSLWSAGLRPQLAYRDGVIIETGFAPGPVGTGDGEAGGIAMPQADSAALVFFARFINLRPGDRLRLTVEGPGNFKAANETKPLDRKKAHFIAFAGKKRRAERWASGLYRGQAEIIRGDAAISQAQNTLELP
jgi:murein DD-endopeptidase MepM/ murein hydrolase activator NlpD